MIGCDDQLINVLGPHAFAASIGRLDFDLVLLAHRLYLLILVLDVFKVHRLHIYDHSLLVFLPEVEGLFEFTAVQFYQFNFEFLVHVNSF